MADAKVEIKVGTFSFAGEGTEKWLSSELEKLLARIPQLVAVSPAEPDGDGSGKPAGGTKRKGNLGTLAQLLRDKNATENQVKKFLATAVYLHGTTGKERLTTGEVKAALKNAHQSRINNRLML